MLSLKKERGIKELPASWGTGSRLLKGTHCYAQRQFLSSW